MGRYNRQARRKMRKSLGAGAKISNDALETAIDIQREAMQAERLVPTMKNLVSEDLRKKYERQVNKEILPRIIEQYLLMTMYILHTWDKTRFGPKRMQDFFVEIFQLQLDMKRPELGLTIEELRKYLESENLHYEDLVAAADKMVAENEKKVRSWARKRKRSENIADAADTGTECKIPSAGGRLLRSTAGGEGKRGGTQYV